ncbi:hypothetical protein AX761_21780 [Rhizobium sp. 58]|nr:hypothetical protein AX761_21780 [Rhizobium sp. 58]
MSDRVLAIAQNCATNGRLFSCMLFAASFASYLKGGAPIDFAVWAAAPVGLSVIVDQLPTERPLSFALVCVMYALSALVAILLLTVAR